jgi:hypothetical protein
MCYNFKDKYYEKGLLDDCVDATYIIHLTGNVERHQNIMNQLKEYQPTKLVYIVENLGFKKCEKGSHVKNTIYDLIDAFKKCFIHADENNYNNILILEDDFIFSSLIKKVNNEVCEFVNTMNSGVYYLGCLPKLSLRINKNTLLFLISTGTHAVVYTKHFRKNINYIIDDWDININLNFPRYGYYKPLCYQLFPETENQKQWMSISKFTTIPFYKFMKLDTQPEPGFTIMYNSSQFALLIILFVIYIWVLRL